MNDRVVKLGSLLLALVVASAVFGQGSGLPRFRKHESYSTVRIKMLKAGWKPYHASDADECNGDERCEGRPEMKICSGTGMAFCVFLWKRNGKTAYIQTAGENTALESYRVR